MVASILRRGQMAIIQVDSEDSDDPHVVGTQNMARDTISFMLLAPVGSGTTIYFTDRGWNGTNFSAAGGDGTYAWTAGLDLPAGTVITISEAELTAAGIELADSGEAIYVYQGTDANTPTTFLHAVEYGDSNTTFNGSLVNTGLVAGTSALAIAADNVNYGERTWNHQADVLFQNINNSANWSSNENSPHTDPVEGTNGSVAPDIQLWIAGISGGHGLFSVNGDATQNGGLGYNVGHHFQNTATDGAGSPPSTTQRFWSPTHILFDTVAGKFFIVDSSGTYDRVLQGNISDLLSNPGSAPTMTILWQDGPWPPTSDGDGVTSIQLDKTNGDVYFTADNKLHRLNYDTANQTAVTLADLGTDPDSGDKNWANELVLDLANGRAFIVSTQTFSDFVEIPPGSGNVVTATTTYQNSIHRIENISPSDTNATGNTITELQFTGIYDESLNSATGAPDPGNFEDYYGKITDIDYNTSTGEFWFTAVQLNGGTNGETGGIYKATLSGSTLTVTLMSSETNATNRNYTHIHIDEETGYYYVTSVEPGESGNHAVYRGLLSSAPGTAPTLYADVGNINEMTPRDLTVESAPTLTGSAVGGLAVTEASVAPNSGETSRVTLFTGLSASDIDTPNGGDELAGALVRVSSGFTYEATSTATGHTGTIDYLWINGTTSGTIAGSGITYSYDQTTGVMTLSGAATVAEYASALALVQFSTSGDNVTNDGTATSRTIAASVFDGLLYSDEITNTVSVTGINDAPVNTPGVAMNFTEDTTGNVGGNPSPPPAVVNAITGISIADADADATTENFTVTLTVNTGTLTIRTNVTGGLAAGDVTGNGTATLTLTGTQTEINTTLAAVNGLAQANGLVYTPPANFNGAATLTIVTNDQGNNGNDPGNSGTGTTEQDSDTKTLNIADVNDAPTVGGDGTEDAATILEDTPQTDATAPTVATLFGGQFADAADVQFHAVNNPTGSPGDTFAGIAIVADGSSGATGQWEYWTGAAWADIGSASLSTARTFSASTLLRFNPALNYNGAAPTLTVHLIETGGAAITNNGTVNLTGATGGTTVYSTGTVTLSQAITAVNDAPVNTAGATVNINEDATNVVLSTTGNAMSVSDVEAAGNISYTLGVGNGTLTIRTDVVGGITAADIIGGANGTDTIIIEATVAEINATLAASNALLYTPTANYNGTDTLDVYANDVGQTGTDPNPATVLPDASLGLVTEEDYDERTINIASVNDEPAGADKSVTMLEDGTYTFAAADFGFSDTDGDSLLEVVITTTPAIGALRLNGGAVSAGQAIAVGDIGLLTYQPVANTSGAAYSSFTFQVRDAGGTSNGGQNTDQTPNTFSFDVTAVNDEENIVALQGDTVNFTEGGAAVITDQGANSAIASSDIGNYGGGTLTISITGNKVTGEDQLGIDTSGLITITNGNELRFGGTQIGTITSAGGAGGGDIVISLNSSANANGVGRVLRSITYLNSNTDDPSTASRTITYTLVDGGGTANGGDDTTVRTSTVTITAVDDAAVAQPDAVTTAENAVGTGDVFANNGSGVDADVDGTLAVSAVNGVGANVGTQITLDSGALLTLNADGTYSYDPNGAFNYLVSAATAAATGAVNDSATDTFTYTLAGGNTVTVTMTVTGVDGAGDELRGDVNPNSITGTGAADLINLSQGGDDTASGGGGNDGFYMGAALTADDNLDGQAGTNDQVGLQGSYGAPFTFGANNLVGIETLVLLPGNDTRFGDTANNFYSYHLATIDANVAAGQRLTVNFNTLRAGENVTFDGSAELDGSFLTFGGQGNDTLTGGQQSDGFYFGFPNRWSTGDSVDGQGGADDQLGLQGNYSGAAAITFGAGQITGIETIVFMTGGDTRFGNPAGVGYSYDITMDDANVAAGQTMTINANTLRANVVGVTDETLTFDGSAELDGNFTIYSGAGADTIVGGAGNDKIYGAGGADTMTGGAGNDKFAYMNAAHSTPTVRDAITDFTVGDLIDLLAIDANTLAAGNQAFSFIGSLAFAGTGAASAGELRAQSAGGADWLVQGDTDGNGVADWELFLTVTDANPITSTDFVL